MKLKKRVKVLDIRVVVNAGKKDFEIIEQIAEALDLKIGSEELAEFVELKSGFTGDLERLKRGLI